MYVYGSEFYAGGNLQSGLRLTKEKDTVIYKSVKASLSIPIHSAAFVRH